MWKLDRLKLRQGILRIASEAAKMKSPKNIREQKANQKIFQNFLTNDVIQKFW